jgi:secreted trypsin-like serine protease
VVKGKLNLRASLAAVGIGFWLTMAGGVSAGPGGGERIVGGNVADPAEWPFIAAIASKGGGQYCGGSVLSEDAVVTAAHCVEGSRPKDIRVITGRPDLDDASEGQKLKVSEITVRRKYRREGGHDVAVVRLKSPTTASPVLLPTVEEDEGETEAGDELRGAGWGGTTATGGNPSDVLLDVAHFAISDDECRDEYFPRLRGPGELCAFGEEQGTNRWNDSCYGDSGGPLVADNVRGALLVGIVSYGGTRCGQDKPGVYSQVADDLRFIGRKADLP